MEKKTKIVIASVIMVMLSIFIIPTTLSMLKSSVQTTSELALSEWNVTLVDSGDNTALTVVSGTAATATYTINVRSLSEVDVEYNIIVDNLPSGVEVDLDDRGFQTPTNNSVTLSGGTILYSDSNKTKTHTLTFRAVQGATIVNAQAVTINVLAQQTL